MPPWLAEVSDTQCWTGGKHPVEISRSLVQRQHAKTCMCMWRFNFETLTDCRQAQSSAAYAHQALKMGHAHAGVQ